MSLQLTTGYAFTSGELNVTHTKLNNAVNLATCTAGSIATADMADDSVTADKINANTAGTGLEQDTDGSLKPVGYGLTTTALTNANVTLTRSTSKANQKFTGTLSGAVVLNLSRTNAIAGDVFDILISAVDTTASNTLTIQENGSGSLIVYNSVATVSQEVLCKFNGTAWIVYSVTSSTASTLGTVTSVDASGGVETVAGSAITATGTIRGSCIVNAQTGTTYTYLTGDRAKLVTHTNGSAIAGTLPQASASFPSGWFMHVQNRGAGTLTITPTTSTIDGAATLALTTNQGCIIFSDGTNYFTLRGVGVSSSLPTGFTSSAQTITTAGALTLAHSLGAMPKLVQCRLVCTTGELGYSIADEVIVKMTNDDGAANFSGMSVVVDATNVVIRFGNQVTVFRLVRKDTGNIANATNANWTMTVRAWV